MKKYLICFIVLIILFFNVNVYAESVLGIGYGKIVLPSNSDIYSLISPNGEDVSTPYIYWNTSVRDGFGYGLSFSGYNIKKYVKDSTGRVDTEWDVSHFSIFAQYQIPLSSNKLSPLLGLRLGGTIAPITYNASSTVTSSSGNKSANETKFGPCFGADIQIPLENTSFVVFGTVEKSIISSTILDQDINVGALVYAVGLGYRFK